MPYRPSKTFGQIPIWSYQLRHTPGVKSSNVKKISENILLDLQSASCLRPWFKKEVITSGSYHFSFIDYLASCKP